MHAASGPSGARIGGSCRALVAGVALALLACPAVAGPCLSCEPFGLAPLGWWDDRPLDASSTGDDSRPRVDADGDFVSGRVVVAWQRGADGAGDIRLATSDDGGCTWDVRDATTGPEDDRTPDVAVSAARGVIALVFVRDGVVVATVSIDGGRTFSPPEAIDPTAPLDGGARPRLAMIASAGTLHLHVAWSEGGRLRLARSLAAGAPGWWLAGPPLSDRFTGRSRWDEADVSADTRSSNPATQSGVTIVAAAVANGSPTADVVAIRSLDSGATFYGDPATPSTLDIPARVSDAGASAFGPVLDSSDDGSGEISTWHAVLSTDLLVPGGSVSADAREEEGVTPRTLADWSETASGDVRIAEPASAAALSVFPNPLARPAEPEVHAFLDAASGTQELLAWRAELERPDPWRVSATCGVYALTGLTPARLAGGVIAGSASADEDLSHVFVAWTDTRDGGGSIWWKRTDSLAERPTSVTATAGDCASGGGLLVSWQLPPAPPACDVEHVRVEWGRAAGVFDDRRDVATGSSLQILGLPDATEFHVRVTLVDEACNEAAAPDLRGVSGACAPPACPNPVGGTLRGARRPAPTDVELAWAAPPVDATHDAALTYDVYRSTLRARDGFAYLDTVATERFEDRGAVGPTTAPLHFYRVVARNACGTSGDEPLP